jgi:NAD+ diphosphatase
MERKQNFIAAVQPPAHRPEPAWWFAFQENKLLVFSEGTQARLPYLVNVTEIGLNPLRQNYLGMLDGVHCYAAELGPEFSPLDGMVFEGLRQLYGRLDEDLFPLAGRALQIVDWDRTHQFCSRCGTRLETKSKERAKGCPRCGQLHFPRLAPAIIVLVERNNQVLLARSRHFTPGVYSVLAGFVDPGESLEETLIREVREETGVSVKDIRYFGSQSWPFPHSLMLGFTATYAGGKIVLNDGELEDAGWFTAENHPPLPGKISIARKLVEWFLAKHEKK